MRTFLLFYLLSFIITSCSEKPVDAISGEWLIPKNQVFDGGPGKDGIPALFNPRKETHINTEYLQNSDLVVVYKNGDHVVIYPHRILDWHEIINDDVGDNSIAVSYCPLTGSALAYNRTFPDLDGNMIFSTFGVSGLLYNSNLILYDRRTDSYWSQMQNQCVAGDLVGLNPVNEVIVETTYLTAKQLYPAALVVSNRTDVYVESRYDFYPYGDYRTSSQISFPVNNSDNRLHRKERVLGVLNNGDSRAYRFEEFKFQTGIIRDQVGDEPIVIVGDANMKFMVAYKAFLSGGSELTFSINKTGEKIFEDNLGNSYNLFGEVIAGPNTGERLEPVHGYIAFWFAWTAFHPETDIFNY